MPKWLKTGFFVVLILSVAMISIFPKAPGQGNYQSVNGPTTVFGAWRAALLVTAILLGAGLAVHASLYSTLTTQAGAHDPKERSCTMLC
jgi:hypothetical protein